MAESQVRQNYHRECEDGVNRQINLELYAMYTYLSMVSCSFYVNLSYQPPQFSFWLFLWVLCELFCILVPLSLTTLNETMWPWKALPSTSGRRPRKSWSTPKSWWSFRMTAAGASFCRTSSARPRTSGEPDSTPCRRPWSWKKQSTRRSLTCTRWPTSTATSWWVVLYHRICFGCIVPTGSGLASSCLWYSPGNGFSECAGWHSTVSRPALWVAHNYQYWTLLIC